MLPGALDELTNDDSACHGPEGRGRAPNLGKRQQDDRSSGQADSYYITCFFMPLSIRMIEIETFGYSNSFSGDYRPVHLYIITAEFLFREFGMDSSR